MNRCPTCDSPAPNLHPTVQCEGEVQICRDSYHRPETGRELDDGDPSFTVAGRIGVPARPALQNLPGTPAAILEHAMACCTPVSCGYHLGKRGPTTKERGDNWDEERRGWMGL